MADVHRLRPNPVEPWGGFLPAEITERPRPREWIIDAMIPRKTVILMAGAPKTAKSLLLQQMLTSTALGKPWLGRHVEQVRSLGLLLEDDPDELKRRQCNICDAYETDISLLNDELELNPREWLSTKLLKFPYGKDIPVWTEFGEQFWHVVEDCSYHLVGIDTATAAIGSPSRWTSDRVFNAVRLFAIECARLDCAILFTDHTNRADAAGFAGPNTWLGSVRAAMNLRVPVDEMTHEPMRGKRILRDLGGNYGYWEPINLIWQDDILVPEEPEPLEARPQTYNEKLDFYHEMARYLGKCVELGKVVPVDELDRQSLPNRIRKWRKIPLNDLYRGQQWILDHHLVEIVKVNGKPMIRPKDMRYPNEEAWNGSGSE